MAQGPLGLPRPFAEEFESPLYMIIQVDRQEHQADFDDPVIDDIRGEEFDSVINNLAGEGIAINTQKTTFATEPRDLIIYQLELAVTNLDIQIVEDIRTQASTITGYMNLTVSTTPVTAIERFR